MPVGGKSNGKMVRSNITWDPILVAMNDRLAYVNSEIMASGYTRRLPTSFPMASLRTKFSALGKDYKILKTQHLIRKCDYPGTGSPKQDVVDFEARVSQVIDDYFWFQPFDNIFAGCARYDTGLAECTLEPEDNLTLLDDVNDDAEVLELSTGLDNAQEDFDTDYIPAMNSTLAQASEPKKGTREAKGSKPKKMSPRVAKTDELEKDGAVHKLSARTLAIATANNDLKKEMHKEMVQTKLEGLASMQESKMQAKMDMVATTQARKDARRQKAQEAVERQQSKAQIALERQESLKRTVDVRDRYMQLGFSPISATAKAKLAEKALLDL